MSDLKNNQENITKKVAKKLETPAKTLDLLMELQNILSSNETTKKLMIGYNDQMFKQSQSELWFEEDKKVLFPLLQKLQKEFSLSAIGIIQKAAPGYYNEFIIAPKNNEGEYDSSLQDLLEESMRKTNKDYEDYKIKRMIDDNHQDKVSSSFGLPLAFQCSINNNLEKNLNEEDTTFGYLGFISSQQQALEIVYNEYHDKKLSKLIIMIAKQLGLYFSHLNLTRRKFLYNRLEKTIEVSIPYRISILDNSNDPKQIIADLADFIKEVFDQHAGAIYTYVKKDDHLEKTISLDPWSRDPINAEITAEKLFNNKEILDAIKGTNSTDYSNNKIDPVRYIFPVTSTSTKYSRALVIYESSENPELSEDEIYILSYRLEEIIGPYLQAAENFDNGISSITEFEDLIKNISDPNEMQKKMIKVISDHLKVDIISYMEVDPSRKYLILKEVDPSRKHLIFKKGPGHSDSVVPNETKQSIEDSISGLVVKYGKTLYIKNINDLKEVQSNFPQESPEKLKRLFSEQYETTYHTKSLLSVPLITGIGNEVTGVINVNNKDNKKPFSLSDKRFLEAISALVAAGINNVSLLSETKERELLNKNAREIQMSLMPTEKDFKRLPTEIDIYGESSPAKEVGGDLFETVKLRDGRLLVLLGDVSGKGSSAAIIMAIAQTIIKTLAPEESNIISILQKANKYLSAEMEEMDGKFVTLQLVAIDIASGECEFASAGHGPLLVKRKDKEEEIPPKSGMPLGLFDPPLSPFVSTNFKLNPGDSFVMFTDGLYEESNQGGDMFGTDRIKKILNSTSQGSAKEITKALITACQQWREGTEAHDDLTVLTIKYRGKNKND